MRSAMPERRSVERFPTSLEGWFASETAGDPIACRISDLSETGVRLVIPAPADVPLEFELKIPDARAVAKGPPGLDDREPVWSVVHRAAIGLSPAFLGVPGCAPTTPRSPLPQAGSTSPRIAPSNPSSLRSPASFLSRHLQPRSMTSHSAHPWISPACGAWCSFDCGHL
jgi:hypothetical protein